MDTATRTEAFKFADPKLTADGQPRAQVSFTALQTLWFNSGTLCNLACKGCYIDSSPGNDQLAYLSPGDVSGYLNEIESLGWPVREIGFTGGEPFMNPDIIPMLENSLARGFEVLVLTNAMRPLMKLAGPLDDLRAKYGRRLTLRVSLDHYTKQGHEALRGPGTWEVVLKSLNWLSAKEFSVNLAARTVSDEREPTLRAGFAQLVAARGFNVNCADPAGLVLFPEMGGDSPVPEITEACWGQLGIDPNDMMCATSRMVVRHKGAAAPSVIACTLLPHDPRFNLGPSLAGAGGSISLNHPHCAKFCVLGGGACSVS